jgi:hypothetical protein
MVIKGKTRERLVQLLKGVNYRVIVSERTGVHPNTVTNVLLNESDNLPVALELLVLGQEQTKHLKKAKSIAKQLSA